MVSIRRDVNASSSKYIDICVPIISPGSFIWMEGQGGVGNPIVLPLEPVVLLNH